MKSRVLSFTPKMFNLKNQEIFVSFKLKLYYFLAVYHIPAVGGSVIVLAVTISLPLKNIKRELITTRIRDILYHRAGQS